VVEGGGAVAQGWVGWWVVVVEGRSDWVTKGCSSRCDALCCPLCCPPVLPLQESQFKPVPFGFAQPPSAFTLASAPEAAAVWDHFRNIDSDKEARVLQVCVCSGCASGRRVTGGHIQLRAGWCS
jgi:hypothetical protein